MSHKVVENGTLSLSEAGKPVSTTKFNNSMIATVTLKGPGSYELKAFYSISSTTKHSVGSSTNKEAFAVTWNADVNSEGKVKVHSNPKFAGEKGDVEDDFIVTRETDQFKESVKGSISLTYTAKRKERESDWELRLEREDFSGSFKIIINGVKKTIKEKIKTLKTFTTPHLAVVGSFKYGDASMKNLNKFPKMVDYGGFRKWLKVIPPFSLEMMENGLPPGKKKIEVVGYADTSGPEFENDNLSLKRAQAVAKEIRDFSGCSNSVLVVKKGGQKKSTKKYPKDPGFPDARMVTVFMLFEQEF